MKFTKEQFEFLKEMPTEQLAKKAADNANLIMLDWLDAAPTVYSDEQRLWTNYKDEDDKVTGKLVCIEEIKEECKHAPSQMQAQFVDHYHVVEFTSTCKHCGCELVADWKVK